MTNEEWLQSLKPGDKVVVHSPYSSGRIGVVTKLTKTMVLVGKGGDRYSLKSGFKCGNDSWHRHYIAPITDDVRESILRGRCDHDLRGLADKVRSGLLPLSEVREILDWLKQRDRKSPENQVST